MTSSCAKRRRAGGGFLAGVGWKIGFDRTSCAASGFLARAGFRQGAQVLQARGQADQFHPGGRGLQARSSDGVVLICLERENCIGQILAERLDQRFPVCQGRLDRRAKQDGGR